jgi:hypothetical protein
MPAKKTTAKRKPGPDPASASLLMPEKLATLVHYLRHEKVILDSDLAELYGVTTGTLNQAVQRNIERFPADFMFCLTEDEMSGLRCQTGTSNADPNALKSQIVIARNAESSKRGGRRTLPYAFTEQGVAMLSSVLRSERAVEVNIAIMRTFVQLRRLMDSNALRPRALFFSAFQNLSISAFTSRTRLSHHPIRHFREKATPPPQSLTALVGLTIDELRLLIFELTKRQILLLSNQKSSIVIRKSLLLPRHPPFIPLIPQHRSNLIRPACTSPPLQPLPLHFNVRCWAFDVRCSLPSFHPRPMSVIWD